MGRQQGEWADADRARLDELATQGTDLVEAARVLGRRQTDVMSEAVTAGYRIAKAGPGKKWALAPSVGKA